MLPVVELLSLNLLDYKKKKKLSSLEDLVKGNIVTPSLKYLNFTELSVLLWLRGEVERATALGLLFGNLSYSY